MTECTFHDFEIKPRAGVGNIGFMLGVIANSLIPEDGALPVRSGYHSDEGKLKVPSFTCDTPDLVRNVVGMYASQLEDTGPFMAETEDFGCWFWRIKDGNYQQTDAILVPNEKFWNSGRDGAAFLYDEERKIVLMELVPHQIDLLEKAEMIWKCDECLDGQFPVYHITVDLGTTLEMVESKLGLS